MTTEGLLSLCHALKRVEAAQETRAAAISTRRISLLMELRPVEQIRPQFAAMAVEKEPVQAGFAWSSNQLRLFKRRG